MLELLSALVGCNLGNKNIAETVEQELSSKYSKTFQVASIGDRIDTNYARVYAYACDDESVWFEVKVNNNGEIIYDEYASRAVAHKAEVIVNKAFSDKGIDSECYAHFSVEVKDLDSILPIKDYIEYSESDKLYIVAAIKECDNVSGDSIIEVSKNISGEISGITIYFHVIVLTETDYDKVSHSVKEQTKTFDVFDLIQSGAEDTIKDVRIKISDGEVTMVDPNINIDELNKILSGEVE